MQPCEVTPRSILRSRCLDQHPHPAFPLCSAGKLYSDIGLSYSQLHIFTLAAESFERALASGPEQHRAAALLQNMGAAHNALGSFGTALGWHRRAAALHGRSYRDVLLLPLLDVPNSDRVPNSRRFWEPEGAGAVLWEPGLCLQPAWEP